MAESGTVIVDSGIGNVGSVANMCRKVGERNVSVSQDPAEIAAADRLIFPGVGHFGRAAEQLDKLGLRSLLTELVLEQKRPILGICLGMQLLCDGSDEGSGEGLGWIQGYCRRFELEGSRDLKIPHMGWNYIHSTKPENPLAQFSMTNSRMYHVHSFHMHTDEENVLFKTHYGNDFVSGVCRGNIYGVQFHPEKSHVFGMELLRNFCQLRNGENVQEE